MPHLLPHRHLGGLFEIFKIDPVKDVRRNVQDNQTPTQLAGEEGWLPHEDDAQPMCVSPPSRPPAVQGLVKAQSIATKKSQALLQKWMGIEEEIEALPARERKSLASQVRTHATRS